MQNKSYLLNITRETLKYKQGKISNTKQVHGIFF